MLYRMKAKKIKFNGGNLNEVYELLGALCPYSQDGEYHLLFCSREQTLKFKVGDHLYKTQCGEIGVIPTTHIFQKPPLGITPKHIHDEQRREELKQAISRYFEANKPIPIEWVEEYNELSKG